MAKKRTTELLPLMNFFAETLRETLDEWDVSQAEVSRMTGTPSPHLTDMKKSRRRCTPEYDLRLSRYFDTSPGFWLRLQLDFELMRAEREKGEKISHEVQPHAALNAENVEMRNLTRKSDPKKLPPFYTPDPCLQICWKLANRRETR